MLVNTVSTGGNLLMNVGPTALGELDSAGRKMRLRVYRDWMAQHSESIYGCTGQRVNAAPQDCRLTQNGDLLYVHIFAYPFRHLHIDDIGARIEYAEFLHDGSEIHYSVDDAGTASLQLPVIQPRARRCR